MVSGTIYQFNNYNVFNSEMFNFNLQIMRTLLILLLCANVAQAQSYKATKFWIFAGPEKDSIISYCGDTIYFCEKEKLLIVKGAGIPTIARLDSVLIKASNQYERAIGYSTTGFGPNGTVFIEQYRLGWGREEGDAKLTIKTRDFGVTYYLNKL